VFNSSSNWSCFTAGEIKEYAGEIPADGIVEEITFLTDSPVSELFPVWTADGNYIMYAIQRDKSGSSESYIMKANGSEIERTGIGEGNLTGFSDVNPNGTELILTKSIDSQPGLYIVNLEKRTLIRVTDDPDKSEGWGSWCRLGRKIVYTQESAGSPSQLWIVNRDGSNKTRLGTSENVGMGKDWCPLGLKILYSAKNSKEKDDLWVIDWHGTNQTQLTDTPYGEWNPSFSPDGKRIVYVSDEGGKPEIWIWDLEGNYRVRLTSNIGIIDSNPRWSPEGSKIVFTAQNLQNISNNSTIKSSGPDLLDNSGNSLLTNNSAAGDNSIIVNKNGSDSTLGKALRCFVWIFS
jgi:TolB protein